MQNKLQELTDKIYREGVTRANEEAEKILSNARSEAKKIQEEAEKRARSIIEEAGRKADEIVKNGNSELKISFRHAVNTLKQDIEKTLSKEIVSGKVASSMSDETFVADLIKTICQNWKPESGGAPMEVMLPEDKAASVEKRLRDEIGAVLGKGLVIKPVKTIKSGFEIVPSGSGFKISATGPDIEAYLMEFIRPKLVQILFEEV